MKWTDKKWINEEQLRKHDAKCEENKNKTESAYIV